MEKEVGTETEAEEDTKGDENISEDKLRLIRGGLFSFLC